MARRIATMALIAFLLVPLSARAQFGGGTQIVFDPSMFARQLQQLQQETQTVLTEAQQLQYMIRNTTGGYAGVWQSNQSMLDELGGIIQQQGGLSYTLSNLQSQFQRQFPGYTVPSNPDQQEAKNIATTLNTLNGTLAAAQSQAQNFANEHAQLAELEGMNKTTVGNLQAIQVGNEIALQQVQQVQMLRQVGCRHDQRAECRRCECSQSRSGRGCQYPTVAQRGVDGTVLINHAQQRSQRSCPIDGGLP